MNLSDFTKEAAKHLVRAVGGFSAFVPPPLPPSLPWSAALATILAEAADALGELRGTGRLLRNPHLLIRPFMQREAVLSSRIEGTQASLSDLFFFEAAPASSAPIGDVKEVHNYVAALDHGLAHLPARKLSLALVRELHQILMDGVRGQDLMPGQFRTRPNWIGNRGRPLSEAIYVPPPIEHLASCLANLEHHFHAKMEAPVVVRLALLHYQFEAIHPFVDGNGRVGRLLITLLLAAHKVLPQPLLYLSAYFERHREAYAQLLLDVTQRAAWMEWIEFFARGVVSQAKDAVARITRLLALHEELRDRVASAKGSALTLKLVDSLFTIPVTSAPKAMQLLHVTAAGAQKIIERLIDHRILVRADPARKRNRLYLAPRILAAVDAPAA